MLKVGDRWIWYLVDGLWWLLYICWNPFRCVFNWYVGL